MPFFSISDMIDVNPKTMMEFPQITYTLNLAVALFAVFVAPFAITALYKNVKNVHRNLKVISMAMAVCWMLQPLMTAAFLAVLLIKSEDVSITEAAKTPLGLTTRQIMTVASHSIKTLEVMLAMERVLATVYSKVYEKAKAWYFLGVFTVIFCVLLAILVNAMVNIFHVSFYITWAFLVSTDIFTFVSLVILSTYNRRLRLKSATTAVALSEKYQIIENITSIRLFIYSSSIWFIFSSTALVMSIVTDSYMAIGNPYYFGDLV
uniref:G_PROTEIN_RECEP_F1_2 domain-containing protein n=1 Tax=Panagrellus redivivus TaxID=6233 RepID=A0A7E4ZY17_PANRE